LLWQPKAKSKNIFLSKTTGQISIIFGINGYHINLYKVSSNHDDMSKNMAIRELLI